MTQVTIPSERKCYGTFDLDYITDQEDIPTHGKRMIFPKRGELSFEHNSTKVIIEFTKEQWIEFMEEMKKIKWIAKEHFGQC
jgi:hypothetical protein